MKKQLKYVRIKLDYIQRLSCVGGDNCENAITKIYFLVRRNDEKIVFFCKKHGLKSAKFLKDYDFKFMKAFEYHHEDCNCSDFSQHRGKK